MATSYLKLPHEAKVLRDGARSLYFHSTFHHVTEDLSDPQIPVERLLAASSDSGFQGVLMSEYEGHAFHLDDAHEQLERHLRLEQRILRAQPAPA